MDRLIMHCDCNNFYASCECLERPELKLVPMAVAGDPERRTGIVVAKNELAKRAGVKTTDTVWAARRKCPDIVFVPPRHDFYEVISRRVNEIYHQYTEFVEPASIDESYLDMTGSLKYYGMNAEQLADTIREHVRREIGITISVGVSYNKVFAKMGSDYRKPDATTVISRDNYREILWPLPVSELLYAGRATVEVLEKRYIHTIGDLARTSREYMHSILGKGGEQLWIFANGLDREEVCRFGDQEEAKSISRGMTFRRNLVSESEVKTGLAVLVDEVAMQLRRQELAGSVVQVQIKTPELNSISRQITLPQPTRLQHEIMEHAFRLVRMHWKIGPDAPIRAMTVGITNLQPIGEITQQISVFDMGVLPDGAADAAERERREKLEAVVDELRRKHGNAAITLGIQNNAEIGVERMRVKKKED